MLCRWNMAESFSLKLYLWYNILLAQPQSWIKLKMSQNYVSKLKKSFKIFVKSLEYIDGETLTCVAYGSD